MSCARSHTNKRGKRGSQVTARGQERVEDTVCSVVHSVVNHDVISEIHTHKNRVSYVAKAAAV